jgi:DNA-directed RNA polymerase subunit M/transcription elongation factor TFIIS
VNSNSQSFAIACPHCGVGLKVAIADLGEPRRCPECQAPFRLPSPEQAAVAAAAKRRAAEEFGFACQLCGSRLYALPHQVGNPIKCPDCHTTSHVPAPKKKETHKAAKTSDGYELALADDDHGSETTGQGKAQFTFHCRVCQTMLSAPRDAVGRHTACPDCNTVTVVPKPPPPQKKVVVKATDPGILVKAATPRPQQEKVNVDDLMDEAESKIAEQKRKKPKPPKHPFLTGVFTFPFQLLSLPYLIVFTFLGCLLAYLVEITLELQGIEAIIGILLMVIAAAVGLILVGLSCTYFLKVINWTAMGYPNVQDSPQLEALEFARQALFIINAFGAGALPGLLLGMATHDEMLGFAVMMLSAFILFPFILLSFIDAESPAVPYSSFVMSTFRSNSGGWMKFYFLAAITTSIAIIAHLLAIGHSQLALPPPLSSLSNLPNRAFEYSAVALTVMAAMIYFRLLGRLAYVIEQTTLAQIKQREAEGQETRIQGSKNRRLGK